MWQVNFKEGIMKTELILKRDDGKQVQIIASCSCGTFEKPRYTIEVYYRHPPKRKWTPVFDSNSFEYRRESFPEGRYAYESKKQLLHVSEDEIQNAKLKLWESLKPTCA